MSLLQAITAPESVALVGASNTAGKLTARPQTFLEKHGYAGRVYPVNPSRKTVLGREAFPSVTAIPGPVDHAYILLDSDAAVAAVEDCARAGVKVVTLVADGFADAGEAGKRRQQRLLDIAATAEMTVIGPNSTGIVDTRSRFACTTNAAFAVDEIGSGRLAVISQSGSLIGTVLSRGQSRGLSFSTFVSVGNEAQMGIGEVGSVLVEDDGIDAFLLFMETVRRPKEVEAFARRAAALGKPVVAFVVGMSDEGQALSVSHTGAMTGGIAAIDGFLRSCGIARVSSLEALIETPQVLLTGRSLGSRPKTVTVVTTTGGGGAVVVDQLSLRGVEIAAPPATAVQQIADAGVHLGHGKLVDVTLAGTNYATMKAVLTSLMSAPETGAVVVAIGSSAQFNPELAVKPILDAKRELGPSAAPVFAFPLPQADESLVLLNASGVPAFRSPECCGEALAALFSAQEPADIESGTLPRAATDLLSSEQPRILSEVDAGEVFQTAGIAAPPQIILAPDQPVPADLPFGFPCVAKLVSADLPHKSDAGAIKVGLRDIRALGDAIAEMRETVATRAPDAAISGVLVQQMQTGVAEVIVGLTRDPVVGPVISVGMGGIMTEIYQDVSVRPAPVTPETAKAMINDVKGAALLYGFRGMPPADVDALAQAVSTVSKLAHVPSVAEAEINPLLVGRQGEGVTLLDALIRLET